MHQQPAHGDFQLRSQILWLERKPLPQGGEHGQEESRRDAVLDKGRVSYLYREHERPSRQLHGIYDHVLHGDSGGRAAGAHAVGHRLREEDPDGEQELSAPRQRGYYHHSENTEKHPHYPHSRRPLQLFAGVYVPLLRAAKGRQALSLHQELSIPRNGVWLQGIGREADTGA